MTPYYADDWLTVYAGDCREVLPTLAADSVDCIVTSPPYWGLRDYGTDGQLGLEPTPEEYVANLVAVFRELRRVLKPSGTCWLNLGDSYGHGTSAPQTRSITEVGISVGSLDAQAAVNRNGLKAKDLVGIPWRVAFALQQPYYTGHIKDEKDRVWLAALMDGEGTFTILSTTSPHGSGNSYPPIAQVRMTSQAVVQKAASLVGVMSPAQYPPSMKGKRGIYQWRLNGRRAADVAAELYPYLIEKRQQAMVVWNHQAVRDSYETKRGVTIPTAALEKQKVCRDLIRRLNRAEPIVVPSWMVEPPSLYEPGWYLRSDVIWSKPNPMPESVTDRPTKAHEMVFLLTKSPRYYFDQDAVREPSQPSSIERMRSSWDGNEERDYANGKQNHLSRYMGSEKAVEQAIAGRNIRSVWTIATRPYPGAHFAVFPPELPERCIKAGSSERGVCPECGAPWERETMTTGSTAREQADSKGMRPYEDYGGNPQGLNVKGHHGANLLRTVTTTGWRPSCAHPLKPIPAVVLDPFAGSGTVGLVANRLSRRAILIDLNPAYVTQQMQRNAQTPLGLGA